MISGIGRRRAFPVGVPHAVSLAGPNSSQHTLLLSQVNARSGVENHQAVRKFFEAFSIVRVFEVLHHDFLKSRHEQFHLWAGPNRNAHEIWQGREEPSNFDAAVAHSVDNRPNLAAKIDHHEIRM